MKKLLNKNGFMFIETIVTLTILMTALLLLYNVFVNLLNKEKIVTNYNKKGYIYALHYVKEDLLNEGYDFKLVKTYTGDEITASLLNEKTGKTNGATILSSFESIYGLKKLYVLKCSYGTIPSPYNATASKELIAFTESIGCDAPEATRNKVVKLIGEFYNEYLNRYYYAYINYPNLEIN